MKSIIKKSERRPCFLNLSLMRATRLLKAGFAMIFIAAGIFVVSGFYLPATASAQAKEIGSITVAMAEHKGFPTTPKSFSNLAEMISPAVVNIKTVKIIEGGGRVFRHFFEHPFREDDPMREFFDRFFGRDLHPEFKQRSLGSGFIIDKGGYIVTNNHVVERAERIRVTLKDGDTFDAKIVGRDSITDLALIKIDPDRNLPVVRLGSSDALRVGEWVLAIGNPFGLEHTVTAGIVSAKGRVIGAGPYDDFIQTDASINPGNSGGPLINMNGEVVGINTAIVAGGPGIGFAIPIDLAKKVIGQLKEHREVVRGWLGVAIQDLGRDLAEYLGVEDGALVAEVFHGNPADRAGIRAGDIIIEVDGKAIKTSRELTRTIAGIPVGKHVDIKALRDGKEKTFKVVIARREAPKTLPREIEKVDELGIRVSELTADLARRFNIKEAEAIVVVGVKPRSKGDKAGVLVGDIISEVNRERIISVEDYIAAITAVKEGESIDLLIRRMGVGFLAISIVK